MHFPAVRDFLPLVEQRLEWGTLDLLWLQFILPSMALFNFSNPKRHSASSGASLPAAQPAAPRPKSLTELERELEAYPATPYGTQIQTADVGCGATWYSGSGAMGAQFAVFAHS
jgi:hypothetical protein